MMNLTVLLILIRGSDPGYSCIGKDVLLLIRVQYNGLPVLRVS
jgi:hypothetical protein